MEKIIVNGGEKLFGEVEIAPAKNACLPLIASTILFGGEYYFLKAPKILDVIVMAEIVKNLGGSYYFGKDFLYINTKNISAYHADCSICKQARASFFIAGALLSRFKKAIVPLPGGCKIGKRPVDIHICALKQLGVEIIVEDERVLFYGDNMKAGKIILPYPSVGATVNSICATVFLKGSSVIENVAKEPEIVDLCNFLVKCGCKIQGIGSSTLYIEGIDCCREVNLEYLPVQDRIEAGTFICMVAVCGGKISFNYERYENIASICNLIADCGVKIEYAKKKLTVISDKKLKCINAVADVFPAFPTDLQSLYCAVCSFSTGETVVRDLVFKNRFEFVKELTKLGVNYSPIKDGVKISGNNLLKGNVVRATDLRGGAGLIAVALGINDRTIIEDAQIIKRGYENIDKKLQSLGAKLFFED